MDAKSDFAERLTLNWLLRTGGTPNTQPAAIYVALLSATASDSATGTELTGGSYARQTATFGAATTTAGVSSATNSAAINWTNLPTVTVTHIAIYDAVTGGNLLYYGALTASKSLTSGDNFTINTGNLTITEN